MDHIKTSSLAVSHTVPKPRPGHRLRRKLQKDAAKQRPNVARRPSSGASKESSSPSTKSDAARKPALAQAKRPPKQQQPRRHQQEQHLPSFYVRDLSDSKWTEIFRGGGCLYAHESPSVSRVAFKRQPDIIPELQHLAIKNPSPPRKYHSADEAPLSKSTAMRRRAKTPIFSIGQLENIPRPGNALGKTSSVELIAEQYRALLDTRNSLFSDSHSEPPPSRQGLDEPFAVRRQQSSEHLRKDFEDSEDFAEPAICMPKHPYELGVSSSPFQSDDGTMVSFEEERVYFKPVSFSPLEPASPLAPLPSPSPSENLSLQICLDLLTRDLSSSLATRPSRSTPETSALQVWVMIEAYERLRDQVVEARTGYGDGGVLEVMFDMWLRALYAVHDSMTDERRSESEYEELGAEELD